MKHFDKVKAIQEIRPDSEFVLRDDELEWLDKNQSKPTDEEILKGFESYQERLEQEKETAEKKRLAAELKLVALGLTPEDLKALGLG